MLDSTHWSGVTPFLSWLASEFDIGAPEHACEVELGQSNPHAILRVETEHGYYGVKRYSERPRELSLAIEYAASAAGIPMPEPLLSGDGAPIKLYQSSGESVWVHVYRWVNGTPYEWNTVDATLSYRIGKLQAAIHAVPISPTTPDDAAWHALGLHGWLELAQRGEAAGATWSGLLHRKAADLHAWEDVIQSYAMDDDRQLPSQRDLHPPNIIRGFDGSLAVIDWDAAGLVAAREDVAMFALVWATRSDGSIDATAVRSYIKGYRSAGGVYKARGVADLMGRERARLAWIEHNIQRHIETVPGPFPWLPGALLDGIQAPDFSDLRRIARLLEA